MADKKPPSRQVSSLDADVQQIHLFAAVRAEKLDTIKRLVPPASLQTHELSTGETPLHVAVDTGHLKVRFFFMWARTSIFTLVLA